MLEACALGRGRQEEVDIERKNREGSLRAARKANLPRLEPLGKGLSKVRCGFTDPKVEQSMARFAPSETGPGSAEAQRQPY